MNQIPGLKKLVESQAYRQALRLPQAVTESYELLAQGEYNRNYLFTHPVSGQKLILRVNCGSQMHLEKQIRYEYQALKLLEASGRTPKAYYVDDSKTLLNHGILVMEYLPGKALDYHKDMKEAARILADIHSLQVSAKEQAFLLRPENGLQAILEECEEMVRSYMESPLAEDGKKKRIRRMMDLGWKRLGACDMKSPYSCCINTELNSTNFLMGDHGYLIDWEKPLYGDPAQDLGHFLAPTTSFWKTDVILSREEVDAFLQDYIDFVGDAYDLAGLKERVLTYIPITCLRGITWCAMAWVAYQNPEKLLFNESTYRKLEAYLADDYLSMIEKNYLKA